MICRMTFRTQLQSYADIPEIKYRFADKHEARPSFVKPMPVARRWTAQTGTVRYFRFSEVTDITDAGAAVTSPNALVELRS